MKPKLFSFFLALVASVGMLHAQSGTCGENLTWNLTDGVLTISGTGNMSDSYSYSSPAPWYGSRKTIAQIVIESGVTSIGSEAFNGCSSLTSITIPNSVTSIGILAFYGCSSLTSITIPNSVTSIGGSAFNGCSSLTSVTIPNSVTSIGDRVFSECSSLTSMNVETGNTVYDSRDNCNAIIKTATNTLVAGCKNTIIPNSVTSIGDCAFYKCSSLSSVTIPNSVTSIGILAFYGCSSLTSITIPNSVTSIGNYAFLVCSGLTSVTIPNSVTSIGDKVFSECSSLTSMNVETGNTVYDSRDNCNAIIKTATNTLVAGCKNTIIPNSVTSIGSSAFSDCSSLTTVTIPNSVTSIGEYAFCYCSSLTSITIPNSVTSIGDDAFYGCSSLPIVDNIRYADTYLIEAVDRSLSTYTIKDGTKWIGSGAFSGCSSLTSITIPNSVTRIGSWAFHGCTSLTSLTIPNSVTSIGGWAFDGCDGLISVEIGNKVTSIEKQTFYGCRSLTNVLIGSSVKVLEEKAFASCPTLDTITCYSMRPPTVNNAFDNLPYSTIVYVPADYLNTYKTHDFWGIYDVRPIGASKTETTEVKVEPTATTADVTWPAVENAATYELVIKDKNGNVICALIFNAQGQLTQIAFGAPARDNTAQAAGFAFTVTGLEEGTSYNLTITAKDGNGSTLDEKTMAFTTAGGTGVEDTQTDELRSTKVLRDGKIYILRGEKTYTVQGQEVK